jgi:hypothetical protein
MSYLLYTLHHRHQDNSYNLKFENEIHDNQYHKYHKNSNFVMMMNERYINHQINHLNRLIQDYVDTRRIPLKKVFWNKLKRMRSLK